MAWTAPRTWVTNEVVSAAIMNTHVRDNLNALGGLTFLRQRQTSSALGSNQDITAITDTDVTGLSVSITVIAGSRIVVRLMTADDDNTRGYIQAFLTSGTNVQTTGTMRALYGATSMGRRGFSIANSSTAAIYSVYVPQSAFIWEAVPGAGTYTVKIQGRAQTTSHTVRFPIGTYLSVEEWGPVS